MKVSVRFEGTGLQLRLVAENEVEQRMVGAVLAEKPSELCAIDGSLLSAITIPEGHYSNGRVAELVLTVHRKEQPA
jgi:hypothetical protein